MSYYIEAAEKPVQVIGLTLSSLLVCLLYMCFLDFAQSYFVPPKHFPQRGSGRSPDKVYRIPHHPHDWVIVPLKMNDEIRHLPESKLSFQQGSYCFWMGWRPDVTNHERAVVNALKTSENSIIDIIYGVVQDESYRMVLEKIGDFLDWTTVRLLPQTISMIMAISQRVFVGEPLCRNEEWLQSIYKTIQSASGSVSSRAHRAKVKKLLAPVLEKRLKDMEDPNWPLALDLMQIVLDATHATGEGRSLEYQVDAIIGTGRAALFTTGIIIYEFFHDLAVHPEYIAPLRQEILDLGNVPFTRANVNKLSKLDSFIRESQRWGKVTIGGTFRTVLNDLTLSDGTFLSAGTYVGTNMHNAAFDDGTISKPYEFDGFRFDRQRSVPGQVQMHQAVQDYLVYGHTNGNQACPGRYFAAHEAKVVTSYILMNYDFRVTSIQAQNPCSLAKGIMTDVDPSVGFEFKRRLEDSARMRVHGRVTIIDEPCRIGVGVLLEFISFDVHYFQAMGLKCLHHWRPVF